MIELVFIRVNTGRFYGFLVTWRMVNHDFAGLRDSCELVCE